MAAVFITNALLTQWSDQGKARLEGTTLTLIREGRTVALRPAVRFTRLVDEGSDPHVLLGKVKTIAQLAEMGAEHYMDSVILGDSGYHVVEGFLGEISPPPRTDERAPPPIASRPSDPQAAEPAPAEHAVHAEETELARDAEALSLLFLSTVRD